jgi:acyl-coenzyme A synthetase/AMP-(fatty) acid ligase
MQTGGGFTTLADLWQHAVARHASRPLLRSDGDGSCFSYADAAEVVALIASRLLGSSIRKGERICIVSPFHPEAAFVFWAATVMGAVVAPLGHHLSPEEIARLCAQVEPRFIFGDRDRAAAIPRSGTPVVLFDDERDEPLPGESFAGWLHGGAVESSPFARPGADDPAAILFTSGTSNNAKGVVLSHAALSRSGRLMAESYGWQPGDVLLNLGEMHTMSGLRNPCIAALHAGCSFIVAAPPARSNALLVSRIIRQQRATILGCVPSMVKQFNRFSRRIAPGTLAGLRLVLCTGSSLPDSVGAGFEESFGVPVMNYYGLTETAGICAGVIPRMSGCNRGSIGIPLGCQVRIVDSAGAEVAAGETGELLIQSDQLMSGYWQDPQLTSRVIRDGWFHTRDLVREEADGTLLLIDRRGESFKDQRGEFIHPAEIEQIMELHPLVDEAGVCCYTTAEGDDAIAAFVVAMSPVPQWSELEADLRSFVAERLGAGRAPSRIERIDSLPRGTNDKLLRRILRERCSTDG